MSQLYDQEREPWKFMTSLRLADFKINAAMLESSRVALVALERQETAHSEENEGGSGKSSLAQANNKNWLQANVYYRCCSSATYRGRAPCGTLLSQASFY